MRLSRRQLRRLIESTLYEQEVTKGMSTGEMEDAKQEKDAEAQKHAKAILGVTMMYIDPENEKLSVQYKRENLRLLNLLPGINLELPELPYLLRISDEERYRELDSQLAIMFDKSDRVITNKVGLEFMKGDTLANLGISGNTGNLGDYLKDEIGYSNLNKYPHIYALYQANA